MRRILALVAVSMLLLAACGGDGGGGQTSPAGGGGGGGRNGSGDQGGGGSESATKGTVEVGSSDLGDVLVDADGMTLYMFVPDQQQNGKPTCYGECEQAWPVLEATGDVTAGDGLDQSLLGTVERRDGTPQVTYNGLPLYYFSGDEAPGDVAGQGLNNVWWVLSPEGKPVRKAAGAGEGGGAGYSP